MLRTGVVLGVAAALIGAGSVHGARGSATFRTPSGNIVCVYEHFSSAPVRLRCEIRSGIRPLPPKPASCTADWGHGYALRQIGLPHVLCDGDRIYDPNAKALRYGQTWYGGGFACTASPIGLRCANPRGHGFFLSRERSFTFTEPKARNGAFKTPSGNIICGYGIGGTPPEASMECGIKSGLRPPPPNTCKDIDYNSKRVGLTEAGPARPVSCAGDPGPLLPQIQAKARVLAYGSTLRIGGITCTSKSPGLTCRNRGGHGFFLSRERWRTF